MTKGRGGQNLQALPWWAWAAIVSATIAAVCVSIALYLQKRSWTESVSTVAAILSFAGIAVAIIGLLEVRRSMQQGKWHVQRALAQSDSQQCMQLCSETLLLLRNKDIDAPALHLRLDDLQDVYARARANPVLEDVLASPAGNRASEALSKGRLAFDPTNTNWRKTIERAVGAIKELVSDPACVLRMGENPHETTS